MIKIIETLKNKMKKVKEKGWIACDHKNVGCAGLKLEKLLEINPDNFEIPDFHGIEIKTKKSITNDRITLFSATPDSYLFEMKRIYEAYGYPASNKSNLKVLNTIVDTKYKRKVGKNFYFMLNVNRNKNVIELLVYDKAGIIDKKTSWSFDLLKEKLERKLKYLCFVNVDTKYSNNQLYVKYKNDTYYKLKNFETFLYLLENGIITITIRLGVFKYGKKYGQLHDHGTGFCIDKDNLYLLFDQI